MKSRLDSMNPSDATVPNEANSTNTSHPNQHEPTAQTRHIRTNMKSRLDSMNPSDATVPNEANSTNSSHPNQRSREEVTSDQTGNRKLPLEVSCPESYAACWLHN
ncbi:hypothetical protein J6590_086197 [Homalodisca vitripennis]|nr:hypothetical protein J6590_086197 [Homalodisca vitripennis]